MARQLLGAPPLSESKARRPWLFVCTVAWLAMVSWGLSIVWAYDNRPGADANPPRSWPAASALPRVTDRSTIVFLAHPQCACTRASLDELAQILARAPQAAKTYVLLLKPAGFENGWERTDLWRRAEALPNVTVLRDDGGVEARRFGVVTSGETLLYDRRGRLVYSGGVTGSRGHAGDNAGEAAVLALLTRGAADRSGASVFGCPLF
jgi:hypothetical protein